jgi:hypothetical protein
MQPNSRGITVFKALRRFLHEEVVAYILQELRLDGALMPLQLTVEEIAGMALLWQRFLEASNQQGSQEPATGPTQSHLDFEAAEESHTYERSDFEKRMWELSQEVPDGKRY